MLINGSSSLLCMDEANALYLFKDDAIHELSSNEDNSISLNEKELEAIETLKSFVTNYESQFLDTTHLYSHSEKRKIFYSFNARFYFILVWGKEDKITIHPFKDLDALLFQEGPDEEEISSMSSALALELGMMQYNPLMKGFLD